MNGLVKTARRVIQNCAKGTNLTGALVSRTQAPVKRDFTRGIWHMSCSKRLDGVAASSTLLHNHSNTCSCGCGLKAIHTKGKDNQILTYQFVGYVIAPCKDHVGINPMSTSLYAFRPLHYLYNFSVTLYEKSPSTQIDKTLKPKGLGESWPSFPILSLQIIVVSAS